MVGIPKEHTRFQSAHYGKHQISKLEDEDLAEEFHLISSH